MAVYREPPKCPYCGVKVGKAVYKKHSPGFIGDTFLYWDMDEKHDCPQKQSALKDIGKEIDKHIEEARKKGTLPPFFK